MWECASGKAACTHPKTPLWPPLGGESGFETAITMVIQSLDLGVIIPTSLVTAVLLLQKRLLGYTLASVVPLKILDMGAALSP